MALKLISDYPTRLKEALQNMSITEAAEKIGLSKQSVSAHILGKRTPKQPTIQAIARALNVNEAWLLGYDIPKEGLRLTNVTDDEMNLLVKMYKLNLEGRKKVEAYVNDLIMSGLYIAPHLLDSQKENK